MVPLASSTMGNGLMCSMSHKDNTEKLALDLKSPESVYDFQICTACHILEVQSTCRG